MVLSPSQDVSIIFRHSLPRPPLIPTVWRDIDMFPGQAGRSHGASLRTIVPVPIWIPIESKNHAVHAGSYPSMIGFVVGI